MRTIFCSGKRPAPVEIKKEGVPAKRQKFFSEEIPRQDLPPEEIRGEDLPNFVFDSSLAYTIQKSGLTIQEWLATVEKYKEKFGWSDYTTIHKVLVKLRSIPELYIWFSNIADIMDWDQWKKKLLRAFPPQDDYCLQLRTMVNRRRKTNETYVAYYEEKVRFMEPLNLSVEKKVSCLLGGIQDTLVCCVGRVGDYKTPEEVLDYFKSCDDKENIEASERGRKNNLSFMPKMQKQGKKKCFICYKFGHNTEECRLNEIEPHLVKQEEIAQYPDTPHIQKGPDPSNKKLRCYRCDKMGHLRKDCWSQMKPKVNMTIKQNQAPVTAATHQQMLDKAKQQWHHQMAERQKQIQIASHQKQLELVEKQKQLQMAERQAQYHQIVEQQKQIQMAQQQQQMAQQQQQMSQQQMMEMAGQGKKKYKTRAAGKKRVRRRRRRKDDTVKIEVF